MRPVRVCYLAALGLGATLLVLAPGACAQPPPAAPGPVVLSPEALAESSRLYDEGVKAADLGHWEKARGHFLEAWRIRRHWKVAVNLGRAETKVGKNRDAAEHLTFFLKEA